MMNFYYFLRKQAVLKKIKTSFHEVLLNGLKTMKITGKNRKKKHGVKGKE